MGAKVGDEVVGAQGVQPPPPAAPVDEMQSVADEVKQKDLTVVVNTKTGPRTLYASDIADIAKKPSLLASLYDIGGSPKEFFSLLKPQVDKATVRSTVTIEPNVKSKTTTPTTSPTPQGGPSATPTPAGGVKLPLASVHLDAKGAVQISGAAVDVADSSFWQKFVDILIKIFSLGFAPTRSTGDITDDKLWKFGATAIAAAGGPQLRKLITDAKTPEQKEAVIAKFANAISRANPDLWGAEAKANAQALFDHLSATYRNCGDDQLKLLEGPMLDQDVLIPNDRAILGGLVQSDGFGALPAADKSLLLRLVRGGNPEISVTARASLDTLMQTDAYKNAAPADQAKMLHDFVTNYPPNKYPLSALDGAMDSRRAAYTVTGPVEKASVAFTSGAAPGLDYDVVVDGQHIPVHIPKTTDPTKGNFHTIDQVAKGLAAMPKAERALIKEVKVNPGPNPADVHWAVVYGDPGFRSYMTAGADGIVDIYPTTTPQSQTYVDISLVHESGHTMSAQLWGGPSETAAAWKPWRDAMAKDGIVPSGYAKNAPTEDFSEALKIYALVHGTPKEAEIRAMMPERFAMLDKLLAAPKP